MAKFSMTKDKFINQWLRHFAPHITKNQVETYIKNGCLWHVFSFELIERKWFLKGDEARAAYDAVCGDDCIFCDFYGRGVTDEKIDSYLTSRSIEESVSELYVVSKDYTWTYIKTHEADLCGPYFMRRL